MSHPESALRGMSEPPYKYNLPSQQTPQNTDWEKEFFDRFGADKIWVVPSRDNVETILDMWKFIRSKKKEWDGEVARKLLPYCEHLDDCNARWEIDNEECTCGLSTLSQETKE